MGGFAPPQPADTFFSTMAKRGMSRRRQRPQGQYMNEQKGAQPQRPAPVPGGMPPAPPMPPPPVFSAPAGPPPAPGAPGGMPGTGGGFMAPSPQATGSSADVNLGAGFADERAARMRNAAAQYGPGRKSNSFF